MLFCLFIGYYIVCKSIVPYFRCNQIYCHVYLNFSHTCVCSLRGYHSASFFSKYL
jgi:hypothetical protein